MYKKIKLGQFFTTQAQQIFELQPFKEWLKENGLLKNKKPLTIIEPFYGKGDIINALKNLDYIKSKDQLFIFDIDKKLKKTNKDLIIKDTLKEFPSSLNDKKYDLAISNPPYLSKVSASNKKIKHDFKEFDDLYEIALNNMLNNADYVAVIIPESFITSKNFNYFKQRLNCFISLIGEIGFEDTQHPVCLALFNKKPTKKIKLYQNNQFLGFYDELLALEKGLIKEVNKKLKLKNFNIAKIKFNDVNGIINVVCFDNTKTNSILFTTKQIIEAEKIKQSSRSKTKITLFRKEKMENEEKLIEINDLKELEKICELLNEFFFQYRNKTHNLFLTSFKGKRKDGFYRRRLSFIKIRQMLITD